MANNAANVSAGKPKIGGAIYRAPLGTTLPTAADAVLDAAFAALGYVSDEGVTNANSISTENVKAWGGDTVLVLQSEKTDTVAMTLIEVLNVDVLKAVFGADNISGTLATGITVNVNAAEQEEACWVIDMILKGNTAKRLVVPRGKITELQDVVYADNAAIGYGVTITCLPDSADNTHYEYIKTASTSS